MLTNEFIHLPKMDGIVNVCTPLLLDEGLVEISMEMPEYFVSLLPTETVFTASM